jgi:signal transduction histidine kinase
VTSRRKRSGTTTHRNNELSSSGRRLAELEKRSMDSRKEVEDLFHGANNALFVMQVNLELLTRHLKVECKHPEVKKWNAVLGRKINEIKDLNGRLFATSAGRPSYPIHSFVSFRSVVEGTLEVYEDVARKKRIELSWQLPDFPTEAIWTDGVAIGTILDNLISNAIKFSPSGTTITVSLVREGTELICSVCDQGPGLSKKDVSKVFQRDARLGPKPTGGESSMGYGLSIAKGLVRKLGGWIRCESVVGEGTCFIFSLPAEAPWGNSTRNLDAR